MKLRAYKGFDKDLKCRDFQYEVGKEYSEEKADICSCGFHACEHPLDTFRYYGPNESRYCEVELDANDQRRSDDSKRVGKHIALKGELSIAGLVKAAIDYTFENAKESAKESDKQGASSATGAYGASSATGAYGASSATGACGASSATGYCGASSADNKDAVAVAWGYKSKAKGVIGAHLVFADWEGDEDLYRTPEAWTLKGAKMVQVDGKKIKENTWYCIENGEIIEVKKED